ncbi:hypothetical protein FSP39_006706 [Pinctada imbricata]|uniref:EB1 C-terminal domain-containing protein n=1 Tax=Pinctada imbricata TaxID=66713 RepID=A0AA88YN57_PINIB|nr:hypothetical protein FSP39_006706 [Pinctada imbricata]
MMRQIDQLQKEKRVLMGESDDEQDDMIPAGFFLHHDQSGDLDSLLTPSSPFDIGDVFSEEFTCPREDCQLLHQRYMEMQDRVQNIGFEPMGSFEQNASFELHQAGRAQGFEPEIMDTPVESDEAFELRQSGKAQGFEPEIMDTPVESEEAFELCQSGRAQGFEPEIMDTPVESVEAFELRQSGRAQGFEPEIMDTPVESEEAFVREAVQRAEADRILKHPEFRFQSSRDDEVVAEMKLDKRKDLNEDFNNGMEVREHFIAENDQPETAVSHFTPENSSSEEEVFLVEGFISSEVASRTEMEVDSIETPYTLAGRSLSLPSIHAGGDASVKPAEEPSKMQTYAKHFVQCIEELKSKSVSERESYFMKQSEIQEGLTSRTVDFSLGVEKVVKERKGRKRYASQSSPVKTEETNQFLRQYSYEAEDILSVDTGREKEKQIDLLPLESKVSCLEFQISFLEQKINNLEKDKRDVQIELDNEILQRQHLEEEIENLNIDVSQSEAKSGSERKSRRDRNQSGHHLQSSKDLEAKLDESALTCKYLEKSLSETQAKLEEERRIIMDKDREISDLKGQVHVLSVEKSEVEYHKLRMEENLENIQEEIDPLLSQIKTQQKEIEILKLKVPEQTSLYNQHKETQTVENVDIEAKLGHSVLTSKNLEKSLSETQEKLEEERRNMKEKDREISDLKGQIHVLSVEKSEVEYHKLRMEENLENIQEEIDTLLTQIKIQQREIETLKMRGSERQRSADTSDQQTQTFENMGETHVRTLKLRSGYDKSDQEEFTSESVNSTYTASSNVLSGGVVEKLKVELTAAEEEIQRLNVQVIKKTDEIGELESGVLDLQDRLTLKNAEVHSLCEKMQELEKENVELKTQKLNRQSSADELEMMKLRGQMFELNEVLVERGNEIVKLENIIAQLNTEVSRLETSDLDTSSESCQYCVDMDKTVKEKDAYIRKLEEHLLGQSMLPSRSVVSSREVTPTQSPRGGAADHHHTASRCGSTPVLSLRNRDDGLSEARRGSTPVVEHGPESPRDGEKTPTETTVPPLFLPQNTNSAHTNVKEGQKVLPRPDKADVITDNSSHISRESDSRFKTNRRKREQLSGRYKGHGPLLPWRSPLDDFSDQSTISAFSSPRLERGDLLDSHFVPELHSSFRSRSPTCSSVSGSVDGSERILSGLGPDQDGHVALENKHFELIDEITQLRRDLRETKSIYTQENALLQEALDREKWMKESMRSKLGMSGTIVNFDLSAELIALRQKVAMLQETNKMLHSENDKWLRKIQDQEQLVLQLREQLGQDLDNFGEVDILFGKQVLMLQKQRNDLLDKIHEKDLENNRLSNRIGDMNVIEENLRREKDFLKVKLREKEDVEAELVQRKLEMERLAQNQEKLEEMLYHKDEVERELMRQKRLLEMDLSEIEAKLEEKEGMLEIQKNQLLRELKGSASPSPEPDTVGKSADKRLSVHDDQNLVPSGQSDDRDEEEVCRLHSMLEEAEVQHSRAIQSLKHKYNSERQQTNDTLTEQHGDQRPSGTSEQDHEV